MPPLNLVSSPNSDIPQQESQAQSDSNALNAEFKLVLDDFLTENHRMRGVRVGESALSVFKEVNGSEENKDGRRVEIFKYEITLSKLRKYIDKILVDNSGQIETILRKSNDPNNKAVNEIIPVVGDYRSYILRLFAEYKENEERERKKDVLSEGMKEK